MKVRSSSTVGGCGSLAIRRASWSCTRWRRCCNVRSHFRIDLFSVPTGLTSRLWLSGRIALYEQQVAQEDAMAPSEVAALGRLEGVLPHISAAYRRAVLIQV